MNDLSRVDEQLDSAVREVQHELLSVDVPDFVPSPRRAPGVIVALMIVLVGAAILFGRGDSEQVVATDPTLVTIPTVDESLPTTLPPVSMVTGTEVYPTVALDRPAHGESVVDPAFGSVITRVTNSAEGEYIMPLTSAWNADGSRLLLYRTTNDGGSTHQLYDPENLTFVEDLNIAPSDIEEVHWSPTEPDILFFVEGVTLTRYDVASRSKVAVREFGGCESVSSSTSALSWSGDLMAFGCTKADGSHSAIAYSFGGDTMVELTDTSNQDPVTLPSGSGVVVVEEVDGEFEMVTMSAELKPTGVRASFDGSTLWAGQDEAGADMIVWASYGGDQVGTVVTLDPLTGSSETLVGEGNGYPYPPPGTQYSTHAWRAPGRWAAGVLGYLDEEPNKGLEGEIVVFDSAGPTLMRVAHHRSSGATESSDFWASAFVSIDPTGTRVLFSSDWESGTQVDTFLIDLAG